MLRSSCEATRSRRAAATSCSPSVLVLPWIVAYNVTPQAQPDVEHLSRVETVSQAGGSWLASVPSSIVANAQLVAKTALAQPHSVPFTGRPCC